MQLYNLTMLPQRNNSSNKKNSAVFLYDASQSKGLNIFEIAVLVLVSVLIVVVSLLVIVSVKQFINICTCKWAKTNQEREDHYTKDVDIEMEDPRRFSIQNIIEDLESRENRSQKQDIRQTVNKALEMMDRQALVKMEERLGNKDRHK